MVDHFDELRTVCVAYGIGNRHRHCGIVDILRCESEMNEFLVGLQAERIETFFQEIFYCFDVMIGYAFDLLDASGVIDCEILIDISQRYEHVMIHCSERAQRYLAEGYKIFYLYLYAITYQGIFRKVFIKAFAFVAIATVDRGNGCKLGKIHCVLRVIL